MMQRFLFLVLFFCSSVVWAEAVSVPALVPLSLRLHDVKLVEIFRVVYSDVLKLPYILDTDALKLEDSVSVDWRGSQDEIISELKLFLESKGFEIKHRNGVAVVVKRPEPEKIEEVVVYRPKYRSVTYLTDIASGVFGRVLVSRGGIQSPVNQSMFSNGSVLPSSGAAVPVQSQNNQQLNRQSAVQNPSPGSALGHIDREMRDVVAMAVDQKNRDRLEKLLEQLDMPVSQVQLKAVLFEVQKDSSDVSGLNMALKLLFMKYGVEMKQGAAADGAISFKLGDSVDAAFSVLASDRHFKVVSAPYVRVKSGESGRFVVGAEVPVLGAVITNRDSGAVQSVDYRQSGIVFDVRPEVREESVDLQIVQQISDFVPTTNGVNASPTLLKRELKTSVVASDDEVILLGGMDQDTDSDGASGFSFLPRSWWGGAQSKKKTQLLLMLHVSKVLGI